MLNLKRILMLLLSNRTVVLGDLDCYRCSPSTPVCKNNYAFFPLRPAGVIPKNTFPPAGLEVSFLPSSGFDIGAAALDPLFIYSPPLFMLLRQ